MIWGFKITAFKFYASIPVTSHSVAPSHVQNTTSRNYTADTRTSVVFEMQRAVMEGRFGKEMLFICLIMKSRSLGCFMASALVHVSEW